MEKMRRVNDKYVDCFFLGESKDMNATIYSCKLRQILYLDKCPENCPYCMSTERGLQTLRKMLKEKNG